jgi:cysteine desulfurase
MPSPPPPLLLDANAGVPPLPAARAALIAALDVVGNPSSPHALGRRARRILDEARDHVAAALGGRPREVVFTSGASEGNRWLVDALVRLGEERGRPSVVVATPLEHPSLAKPLAAAAAAGRIVLRTIPWGEAGPARGPALSALLADADAFLCTAAHNETGLVPDLGTLLEEVGADAIVGVDAAQAVARLPPLPARVDVVVASAHKIGGHAGAGGILLRGNAARLAPPWRGGGQEAGLRPGTEALVLHASFGAAAAAVEVERKRHAALAPLRDRLEQEIVRAWGARIVGAPERPGGRLPNTTALLVPGVDGDALRIALDGAGVAVGFGAACSALAPEPSPSLMALGLTAAEARATVRLSLAPGAAAVEVEEALARLLPVADLVERSRRRSLLAGTKDR